MLLRDGAEAFSQGLSLYHHRMYPNTDSIRISNCTQTDNNTRGSSEHWQAGIAHSSSLLWATRRLHDFQFQCEATAPPKPSSVPQSDHQTSQHTTCDMTCHRLGIVELDEQMCLSLIGRKMSIQKMPGPRQRLTLTPMHCFIRVARSFCQS